MKQSYLIYNMKEDKNIVKNMAEVSYLGALRTQSVHVRSKVELITDAPVDNNGKGEAFSPTDLLATALSACMITIMGIAAEKRGFELPEVRSSVRKIMASEPRRISRIEVDIVIQGGNLEDSQKLMLQRAAKACPVAKSLSPEIEQIVKFTFEG
jgi:uncharacterized OsmC-like protein